MPITRHEFDKEFSYTGHWWLPDVEEAEEEGKQWLGTVTYKPQAGIHFEVMTGWDPISFGRVPEYPPDEQRFIGSVLGNNYTITLLINRGIYQSPIAHANSNSFLRAYRPKYLLAGFDFCSPENVSMETKIHSMVVNYTSLRGWMRLDSPISQQISQEGEELANTKITLEFKLGRKLLEFEIPEPENESTLLFYEGIRSSAGGSKHEISMHNSIQIKPNSPQTLEWFCEQIDSLRDLLAFLSGLPVESTRIRACLEEDVSRIGCVDVYRQVSPVDINEEFNHKMSFPFKCLGEATESVFQRWFKRKRVLRVPMSLCLGVIYREHRNMEFDFLVLVQALEGYFQATHPKVKRPSTKRSLRSLLWKLPCEARSQLALNLSFLHKVILTRNYYSHYNPRLERDALKDEELYEAISKLILFVVTVISMDLKMPKELLFDLYNRTNSKNLWLWQRAPLRPKPLDEENDQEQPESVGVDALTS